MSSFAEFLKKANAAVLKPVSLALFGAAFVIFLWGVVEFIRDSDSDEGRAKGGRNIMWGLLGMVIMISVYGIINIIAGTIGATPAQNNTGPYLLNEGSVTQTGL
jgi:membrane protease YdiL (CAAX protease family)